MYAGYEEAECLLVKSAEMRGATALCYINLFIPQNEPDFSISDSCQGID